MTVPSVGVSETARPDISAIRQRCQLAYTKGWGFNLDETRPLVESDVPALCDYVEYLESRLVSLERDSVRLDWLEANREDLRFAYDMPDVRAAVDECVRQDDDEAEEDSPAPQIIDLMQALRESLAKGKDSSGPPPSEKRISGTQEDRK